MPNTDDIVSPGNPWLSRNSLNSAAVVVPLVLRFVSARRVVDFGCKHGEWLSVFRRHGVATVLGLDQPRRAENLTIAGSQFRAVDLNQGVHLQEQFDLAVCLEVAEHLRKSTAAPLVRALAAAAPVVLFSAALPGQGGHGHLNEQPRAYWHALFAEHGFAPVDCLRPEIWRTPEVAFWYRQNIQFYASAEGLDAWPALALVARREVASDLELVHVKTLMRRSLLARVRSAAVRGILGER